MWSFFNGAGSNMMNDICGEEAPAPSPGIASPATISCPAGAWGGVAHPGRGVMMVAGGATTGMRSQRSYAPRQGRGNGRDVSRYPMYGGVVWGMWEPPRPLAGDRIPGYHLVARWGMRRGGTPR